MSVHRDIAAFMGDLPTTMSSSARWDDSESATRERWHALVTARRHRLGIPR